MQDKRQLTFDTAKAFLTALSSESLLASAKQKLETARANLENAQARAQAGLSSTNDVTKASLDTQTSAQQVAQTQGNVERAYLALSFLVGHAVSGPLAPPTKTTESALHFEATAGSQVAAALERRPDLKSQHEKVEAAWYFAAEPLWRLAPTVSAAGQLRYTPEPIPPANGLTESLTLNLTWTIFDSGFRYADRRTRLAQARSSALDEQYLRRSVETDIATALSSLHTARETYAIAAQAVTFAQKNQDEVAILYKQGLVNGLEVTDANQKRFDAEVVREAAKLAMEQAYLDLRSALGFGPLDDDPAGTQ